MNLATSPRRQSSIIIAALGLIGLPFAGAANFTKGRNVKPFTADLKPGDYLWHPEVSPAGPVVVFASLPDQVMYVYRNGVRIGTLATRTSIWSP